MRKAILIVLLLLACLLLTGCYKEVDPWPSSGSPALQPTSAPGATEIPTDSPILPGTADPGING